MEEQAPQKKDPNVIQRIWCYAYTPEEEPLTPISKEQYYKEFDGDKKPTPSQTKAYDQAWQAKNFEIDNYWKRANYFWLFQAAAFTGYFAVLGTDAYKVKPQSAYMVACIGFLTALAWHFTFQAR